MKTESPNRHHPALDLDGETHAEISRAHAGAALAAYQDETGSDDSDALSGPLADLMLARGGDAFESELERARWRYATERAEDTESPQPESPNRPLGYSSRDSILDSLIERIADMESLIVNGHLLVADTAKASDLVADCRKLNATAIAKATQS